MVDWKRIRRAIGYTREQELKNAKSWHRAALGFHAAAKVLDKHSDCIPEDSRPFAFNAALSIELILKAIIAQKRGDIPSDRNGHSLIFLSREAGIRLTDDQRATLELLTETILWSGRYPAPKSEWRWDEYHDRILEKHIVRSTVGNVSTTIANNRTFPNLENYLKIWEICTIGFREAC